MPLLRFQDKMNSNNPVSDDLNLEMLHVPALALMLILSNFAGIQLTAYGHMISEWAVSGGGFISIFYSVLYHVCQTTDVCFGMSLALLTQMDHISAPIFMVTIFLFFINSSSARQNRRRAKLLLAHYERLEKGDEGQYLAPLPQKEPSYSPQQTITTTSRAYTISEHHSQLDRFLNPNAGHSSPLLSNYRPQQAPVVLHEQQQQHETLLPRDSWYNELLEQQRSHLSDEEFEFIEGTKMYYNGEPPSSSTAWDTYILLATIFVAINAAIAHPFSMNAFLIVILFIMMTIFFKITVIEEGVPVNMHGRIYLPDLLTGVAMVTVSLVFYIVDCFWAYAYTHTAWHVFSYLGTFHMVAGTSRHKEKWFSPSFNCYRRVMNRCVRDKHNQIQEWGYVGQRKK